jgi:hypothetical protein
VTAPLVLAAVIIFVVALAHSYLGERYILIRLFRRLPALFGSDVFTRRTLRMAWHLTTVVWWGIGALLLVAAGRSPAALPQAQLGAIVAVTSLASAVVAFVGTSGRHLSWLAFLVVGALAWWGTR